MRRRSCEPGQRLARFVIKGAMPKGQGFSSKAQWRKCFALKREGKAGRWDCRKWAHETQDAGRSFRELPKRVSKKSSDRGKRK